MVAGSRFIFSLPLDSLPWLLNNKVDGWREGGGGSYAGTYMPNPWRGLASAALAPLTLASSCCNNTNLSGCGPPYPPLFLPMVVGKEDNGGIRVPDLLEWCFDLCWLWASRRAVSMVATTRGIQALFCCCSSASALMSLKLRFCLAPMARSSIGTRHGDGRHLLSPAGLQEERAGHGPRWAALCRLVIGGPPAAGDLKASTGCTKLATLTIFSRCAFPVQQQGSCRPLHLGVEPSFSALLVVVLCGANEEGGVNHLHILLGGTIEASFSNFHRSISKFAFKNIAVLDVMQQLFATKSSYVLIPSYAAIMMVVRSPDLVSSGAIEATALFCHMASIHINGCVIHSMEQDVLTNCSCSSCICLYLSDDLHAEDAVSKLFGLCHRRWTTTPPLLIPRFNGGDALSLSSVKAIRYLQLNSIPRVHIPDRPLGEPPAGHQLDCTSIKALEDCRCGNFGSALSADGRTLFGSTCDLRHLLHEFRSTSFCIVQLGTYLSCSNVESHVTVCNVS